MSNSESDVEHESDSVLSAWESASATSREDAELETVAATPAKVGTFHLHKSSQVNELRKE